VTWSEIAINLGIVLGFSMGLVFADLSDGIQWRVMLAVGMIMPILMIFLVMNVMPESPRWLASKGRETEAKIVLEQVYPQYFPVDDVIADIKESLERERFAEQEVGWSAILRPTPAIKRMLMVGLGIAVGQQAVGIDALQYYLTDVLDSSGVHSQRMQSLIMVFLGLVKLGFILVGGKFFDTRGRRPLMFTSLLGKLISFAMHPLNISLHSKKGLYSPFCGLAIQ
jgi:MFS family permease